MNYSDMKSRLAILLVLVAIVAGLGATPPKPTEVAASIPRMGDLAPPVPPTLAPTPSIPPSVPGSKAKTPLLINGRASWYGKAFHGRETSSGEAFDMFRFTAAHRTLPFGTWLKVTNLRNGKWVIVRINDRGPIIPGRDIDLSYAAAKQLGMIGAGLGRVRIEKVGSVPGVANQPQRVAAQHPKTTSAAGN